MSFVGGEEATGEVTTGAERGGGRGDGDGDVVTREVEVRRGDKLDESGLIESIARGEDEGKIGEERTVGGR
ncbi:unnamed protein product [Arabis nemorensis]|uniref:Uncharacterized protein n=1 Tax=Arabis nemorensis TaxID=586526 RepID=A0A565BFN9_9BRAS|nr:unnamed protein product [Arabis nemorensis]